MQQMPDNHTLQKAIRLLHGGDPEQCRVELEEYLDAFLAGKTPETITPEDAKTAALALDALGQAYFALHDPRKGIEMLRNGVKLLSTSLKMAQGAAEPETKPLFQLLAGLWQNLSFAALELRLYDESRGACDQALKLAGDVFPDNSPELASVYFSVSALHYRLREWSAAENMTLKAKAIWENPGSLNPEKAATCMNNLGRIHEERGMAESGIAWHRKAVAARRVLPCREDLAFSLGNLGVALAQNGQWREACESLREAVDVYHAAGREDCQECRGFAANLEICRKAIANEEIAK